VSVETRYIPPPFMPDGRPAPFLMTPDELVEFLRLDHLKFPLAVVNRMRKRARPLHAVQVGRKVFENGGLTLGEL